MPQLDDLFFAVCQTAIKNCAWKYGDFDVVKRVEGQLELIRQVVIANQASPELAETDQPELPEVKTSNEPTQPEVAQPEAPVAQEANKIKEPIPSTPGNGKLVSPAEAKTAPDRPMPDEILAAVQDGIELAKNPPKVANVRVEELSGDPGEAANQFNKNF